MPHPLPTHLSPGYFDTAFITDDSLVAYPLVLAAIALEILGWSEDSLAEQAVPLRLQGAVVDGLRLGHFTVGPAPDLLR